MISTWLPSFTVRLALVLLTHCAHALPEGQNFVQDGLSANDISYSVDQDLLNSSRLSEKVRENAAGLLLEFRQHERNLVEYHRALLDNWP